MPHFAHAAWVAAALAGAAAGEGIRWRTDFNKAAVEAQQQGKLLVVSIHTKYCGPCRQMERTTFTDPSIAALLNEQCVAVKVDGELHPDLIRAWGVTAFPTELCVLTAPGPDHGKIVARMVGAKNTREYTAEVRGALARMPGPAPERGVVAASGAAASAAPLQTVAPSSAMDLPTACEGRCPVTMVEKHLLVAGQAAETLVHDNQVWRFASRDAKQKFMLEPSKYIPGEKSRCVVTFLDSGRWQPGSLRFPALFADRVYLFADAAARKRFLEDPEKYLDAQGNARRPAP